MQHLVVIFFIKQNYFLILPTDGPKYPVKKRKRKDLKGVTKTCTICNEDVSRNNIAKHVKRNHKLNCHLCYILLESKEELESHIFTEHESKKLQNQRFVSFIGCLLI